MPRQPGALHDYPPTDFIELSKDFFQPSGQYSDFNAAVQKDMTLGYLTEHDCLWINLAFDNVQDCNLLLAKDPDRWSYLKNTRNYYLAKIALKVTEGRGREGFTAKLMRSTFSEHKATMGELQGIEKRREGVGGRIKKWVGV